MVFCFEHAECGHGNPRDAGVVIVIPLLHMQGVVMVIPLWVLGVGVVIVIPLAHAGCLLVTHFEHAGCDHNGPTLSILGVVVMIPL